MSSEHLSFPVVYVQYALANASIRNLGAVELRLGQRDIAGIASCAYLPDPHPLCIAAAQRMHI